MSARGRFEPWWRPSNWRELMIKELHALGERWLAARGFEGRTAVWQPLDLSNEQLISFEVKPRPRGNCPPCGGVGAICRWFEDGGFEVFECGLCAGTGSVPPYHYPSKTLEEWRALVEADLGLPSEKP